MTHCREILRMASAGIFNQREIAQSLKLSRNTVARTLAKAQKELRKTGVTLQMLWIEYYEANNKGDKQPYLYSRYCDLYRQHMRYSHATMRIPRTPGEQVEVDWSGKTGYLKDPTTGDLKPVYFFVAAMSYSQYCYSEGFLRMDEDSWIRAHVHLFEFLGGVPKTVVPDNLKTDVVNMAPPTCRHEWPAPMTKRSSKGPSVSLQTIYWVKSGVWTKTGTRPGRH